MLLKILRLRLSLSHLSPLKPSSYDLLNWIHNQGFSEHRGVQAANPPSGPEAPEQDKDDITSRLLAASAFSDLSLGTGCRNAYSPCCSLQRRPWPLWLMRFPPWKIPAYEPFINDVSSIYGFLDCPHCKYQIHTTSLPLVRNWQPPPHY